MHHLPTRQRPVRILLAATASLAIAAGLFAGAGSARPAHAANNPFTGSWGRHGFTLNIASDGSASAVWRVYSLCSDNPAPPCDELRGTENQKIHCGERHFVGALNVDFKVVTSADHLP